MKKIAIILNVLLFAVLTNVQSMPTRVSGRLEGIDVLFYNIIDMNLDNPRFKGICRVKDGYFDMTVEVANPSSFTIEDTRTDKPGGMKKINPVSFTIIPGEDVTVNGTLDDFVIDGSAIYSQIDEVQRKMNDFFNDANRENTDSLRSAYKDFVFNYIKEHSNDEAAAILVQRLESEQQINDAVALFAPKVRNGRMAGLWKSRIKMIQEQIKREEVAKKTAVGMMAPDFTLPDINGGKLSLSSLQGKYVVLDFWGSWCGWCIKGMPEMKKYYEKYAGKFEILGIDCKDTEEKWKAAVEKHQIPWKHVRQSNDTQSVTDDYGIQGYPTKIVIDPEGKIAKIVEGESPEFYTYLDSLFGK